MAELDLLDITIPPNTGSWGPSTGELPAKFQDMPYQPFKKQDIVGKVSDWTGATYGESRRQRMYVSSMHNQMNMNIFGPSAGAEVDETDFKMVDNNKIVKPAYQRRRLPYHQQQGRGGMHNNRFQHQNNRNFHQQNKKRRGFNNRWGNNRYWNRQNINREASVKIESNWEKLETLDFSTMSKMNAKHVSKPVDLSTGGEVRKYDKRHDRVSLRNSRKLQTQQAANTEFHCVTTTEDTELKRVMMKQNEKKGTIVMATDGILSALMCAPRSVIPWDIKAYRYSNTILLDIDDREVQSPLDTMSVSETAAEPLPDEGVDEINKPIKRSEEAAMINQIISQQVLLPASATNPAKKGEEAYPFDCQKNFKPPSKMYRYRLVELGSDKEEKTKIFVRTEVDGYEGTPDKPKYVSVKALNEWDPKYCNGINWRNTLEKQTSTVLATEMKNNSFKVSRWIMQSHLAGAESIKLAFVTRENTKDDKSHLLVNMESYSPEELAVQAGLNMDNCWGILKHVLDVLKNAKKDGAYYIVRNPNEKELNFYRVPDEDSDESGSGEEGESGEEDDDDEESGSEEESSEEDSDSDDSDEEEDEEKKEEAKEE